MKKWIIFLGLLMLIIALFFPVQHETKLTIKASFINTYTQLTKAEDWKKWNKTIQASKTFNTRTEKNKNFIIRTNLQTIKVNFENALTYNIQLVKPNSSFKY